MSFEKEYYESDEFWSDLEWSWKVGKEKFLGTYNFIKNDVKSVIDLACGNGVFTNYLIDQRKDLRVVGYDRSETALKYVKSEKILGDIIDTPFKDGEFDCVIANSVIEHLPIDIYVKAIREIARISNKYIIISVPYREKLEEKHTKCPSCTSEFNSDLHLHSFDKERIEKLFSQFNYKFESILLSDKQTKYYGHDIYKKVFYPHQLKIFNSPICPLCGYENENFRIRNTETTSIQSISLLQKVKSIPKIIWPTYSYYYESTALFIKKD